MPDTAAAQPAEDLLGRIQPATPPTFEPVAPVGPALTLTQQFGAVRRFVAVLERMTPSERLAILRWLVAKYDV